MSRSEAERIIIESEMHRAGAAVQDDPTGRLQFLISRLQNMAPASDGELPDLTQDNTRTDIGAARALVARHGRDLRHVHGQGWRYWSGTAWASDTRGEVMSRAKATAEALLRAAVNIEDKAPREAAVKWALRCHSEARLAAMVNLAASEPGIGVTPDVFDREPMMLNVANGTIDLKAGQLCPHRRSDLITKLAPVAFDPAATCPVFEEFIERIMGDRHDLIAFLQRAIGYALTADTREQCFFLLHGTGANGKSTLLELLVDLLGDYATTAAPDILMSRRRDEHPTAIADLQGARLVSAVEVDEDRRLAENLVKQLTGGDRMKSRKMRQDYESFIPRFKLFLAANHRPVIRGTDLAIWRRIRLVPFTVTVPPDEQDRELPAKLRAVLPGILRWALAGCLEWQRIGLAAPQEVTGATDEYRRDMDVVKSFLEAACVVLPGASVSKKAMYAAYKGWAESNGEHAISQKRLSERLSERGFKSEKTRNGHFWNGVGLLEDSGGGEER